MKSKVLKCVKGGFKGFFFFNYLLENFKTMPTNKLQTQDPSDHWVTFNEQPCLDELVNRILIFYFMICQQKLNQVFNISLSISQNVDDSHLLRHHSTLYKYT